MGKRAAVGWKWGEVHARDKSNLLAHLHQTDTFKGLKNSLLARLLCTQGEHGYPCFLAFGVCRSLSPEWDADHKIWSWPGPQQWTMGIYLTALGSTREWERWDVLGTVRWWDKVSKEAWGVNSVLP